MLQKQDPKAEVFIEGCDCIGDTDNVVTEAIYYSNGRYAEHYTNSRNVIIVRSKDC